MSYCGLEERYDTYRYIPESEAKYFEGIDGVGLIPRGFNLLLDCRVYEVRTYTKDAKWYLSEYIKERGNQ